MNRIRILREENNITQEELAKKLDLSKGIISLYENETRKPSLEILVKLSELFNCSMDYILCKSDVRNPEKPINDEDVKIVADSGILGLNDYNRQVAIDIIKGLKAKQDIDEKNKKD